MVASIQNLFAKPKVIGLGVPERGLDSISLTCLGLMLTFFAAEAISSFLKNDFHSVWPKRKIKANHKAGLPERGQKASVAWGKKTLPAERDSFVMADFNCWWIEIFREQRASEQLEGSGRHRRPSTLVTLYYDGDKEQGVPFTARLLQPEGSGLQSLNEVEMRRNSPGVWKGLWAGKSASTI